MMQNIFRLKLIYKSGHTHEFDVFDFKVNTSLSGKKEASWRSVDPNNQPLLLGLDDIAAIWQVGSAQIEVPDQPQQPPVPPLPSASQDDQEKAPATPPPPHKPPRPSKG